MDYSQGYIRLFYSNYVKHNNLAAIKSFNQRNMLEEQKVAFGVRVSEKMKQVSNSPKLQSIFKTLLLEANGAKEIDKAIASTTTDTRRLVTTGRKAAAGKSFKSISPAQILNNWTKYIKSLKSFIDDFYILLGQNIPGLEDYLLQKSSEGTLTQEEYRIALKTFLQNNYTFVSSSQSDVNKLLSAISSLENQLQIMMQGVPEGGGKDLGKNIKATVNSAMSKIQGDIEEFAVAHALSIGMKKVFNMTDDSINFVTRQTGNIVKLSEQNSYEIWKAENGITDPESGVQQKSDGVLSWGTDLVNAQLGISTKRANYATRRKYGVSAVSSTPFLNLVNRSIGFNSYLFYDLINIAAVSTSDQIGNIKNTSSNKGSPDLLWEKAKKNIILGNLLWALGGAGIESQLTNDNSFFLVVNRKAYRLDTVMNKIRNGQLKLTSNPAGSLSGELLPRQSMVSINESNFQNRGGSNTDNAFYRSERTITDIMNLWQSTKVSISLKGF